VSPGRSQVEPYQRIARLPVLIRDVKLVTVEGGPHNIGWPRRGQHRPAGVPHQPARRNWSAVGDQSWYLPAALPGPDPARFHWS